MNQIKNFPYVILTELHDDYILNHEKYYFGASRKSSYLTVYPYDKEYLLKIGKKYKIPEELFYESSKYYKLNAAFFKLFKNKDIILYHKSDLELLNNKEFCNAKNCINKNKPEPFRVAGFNIKLFNFQTKKENIYKICSYCFWENPEWLAYLNKLSS